MQGAKRQISDQRPQPHMNHQRAGYVQLMCREQVSFRQLPSARLDEDDDYWDEE